MGDKKKKKQPVLMSLQYGTSFQITHKTTKRIVYDGGFHTVKVNAIADCKFTTIGSRFGEFEFSVCKCSVCNVQMCLNIVKL